MFNFQSRLENVARLGAQALVKAIGNAHKIERLESDLRALRERIDELEREKVEE